MKTYVNESRFVLRRAGRGAQLCKHLMAAFVSGLLAATAWCASGTWVDDEGWMWQFDYAGSSATITGGSWYWGQITIPPKVEVDGTAYTVTAIGDQAFDATIDLRASFVTTITIPSCVLRIGNKAFSGCNNLKELNLGSGLYEIKDGAFQGAVRLENVVIPASVTAIGNGAFSGCSTLETVQFGSDMLSLSMSPESAFAGTPFLEHMNDNDNWANAFEIWGEEGMSGGCNLLATTEPGEGALGGDHSLWWKWTAPVGVTRVAFNTYGSSYPTTLGIYTGTALNALTLVKMGDARLSDKTGFACLDVTPGREYYVRVSTTYGFGSINLGWKAGEGFSPVVQDGVLLAFIGDCPEHVAIPDTVTDVEANAFNRYYCGAAVDNLMSVVIPESVVKIGDYAFQDCGKLAAVTFGNAEASVAVDVTKAFAGTPYLDGLKGNDNLVNAIELTDDSGCVLGWNGEAKLEAGEPFDLEGYAKSLWWKWTAPADATKAVFHTYGSDFDTVLGIYAGMALTKVDLNTDHGFWDGFPGASRVSFDVIGGETYYICVGSESSGSSGTVRLSWASCGNGGFSFLTWGGFLLGFVGDCPEHVAIPDSVTDVEANAFNRYYCAAAVDNLMSVVIPESVVKVGDCAFQDCGNLASVTFKGSAYDIDMDPLWAFNGTPFLTQVNANDFWSAAEELVGGRGSVEAWNGFATAEAKEPLADSKKTLWWKWTAPSGVTTAMFDTYGSDFNTVLGVYTGTAVYHLNTVDSNDDMFSDHTSRVKFSVEPGKTYYICVSGGKGRGMGLRPCGKIKLNWMASSGFALMINGDGILTGFLGDCPSKLEIPDEVVGIADSAFEYYYDSSLGNLKQVAIPGSVATIGESAFGDCPSLESVVFHEGLKRIGEYAFQYCSSLKSITVPSSVTEWDYAFYECDMLAAVTLDEGLKTIGYGAFTQCSALTAISIPGSVTNIQDEAFAECGALASVTMHEGLTSIGYGAFSKCFSLMSIVVPGSVTSIEDDAFADCDTLTSVTFNEGLEALGYWAFSGCTALKEIFLPTTVMDVDSDTFHNMDGAVTVLAPRSLLKVGFLESGPVGTTDLTVKFYVKATLDPNGGVLDEKDRVRMIYGDVYGDLSPLPTLIGHSLAGWKENGGGTAITAATALPDVAALTLTAQWQVNQYTQTFDANGGDGGKTVTQDYDSALTAPTVTRTGYTFVGWEPAVPAKVLAQDVTYKAQWQIIKKTVTLDAGGSLVVDYGTKVADLPRPTRDHYEFVGWCMEDGTPVPGDTPVTSDLKLFAQWKALYFLYGDAVEAAPAVASTYDGYLYRGEELAGIITVKVGKPNKAGLSSVKATVTLAGGKRSMKGNASMAKDGPTTVALAGGGELTLGSDSMKGTYGAYAIDGARNVFVSKNALDRSVAGMALKAWRGAVNVAWKDERGWSGLSVAIANKGKATVSGTLSDGTKVTAKSQMIVGEEWCCVPVLVTKKAKLAFVLWLPLDNGAEPGTLGLGDGVMADKPGFLKGEQLAFHIASAAFNAIWGRSALPYLPDGVTIRGGLKWELPKAGKVAYVRGSTAVDETKLQGNPAGLKLKFKSKDGTFSGSFKAYADVGGKLKATTVNVAGVLVDGVGYGTATIKNVGGVPVTVE